MIRTIACGDRPPRRAHLRSCAGRGTGEHRRRLGSHAEPAQPVRRRSTSRSSRTARRSPVSSSARCGNGDVQRARSWTNTLSVNAPVDVQGNQIVDITFDGQGDRRHDDGQRQVRRILAKRPGRPSGSRPAPPPRPARPRLPRRQAARPRPPERRPQLPSKASPASGTSW